MNTPTELGGGNSRKGERRTVREATDMPAMASGRWTSSGMAVFLLVLGARILALGLPSTGLPIGISSALGIAIAFGAVPLFACGRAEVTAALRPAPSGRAVVGGVILGAFNYVPALALSHAFSSLAEGSGVTADPFQNCSGDVDKAFLFLAIVPLAPLFEEIAFRGVIQRRSCAAASPWLAILLTSAGFALVHLDGFPQMPARLEMGLVFGIAAYRSGTVWMAVSAHLFHNGLALAAAFLLGDGVEFPGGYACFIPATAISTAAVAQVLWKSKRLAAAG